MKTGSSFQGRIPASDRRRRVSPGAFCGGCSIDGYSEKMMELPLHTMSKSVPPSVAEVAWPGDYAIVRVKTLMERLGCSAIYFVKQDGSVEVV